MPPQMCYAANIPHPYELTSMDFNIALQQQLSERQRRKDAKSNVERIFTPKQIQQAFIETFELIGGIPRLALWASKEENFESFMKMLITLAPKGASAMMGDQMGQVIQYVSNVPQSPLNRPAPTPDIAEGVFVEDEDQP